jgi:amino acid transporter
VIHAKTKIPQHMILCVVMALFFIVFYSVLFNFVLPKPRPVARKVSEPAEQHIKKE